MALEKVREREWHLDGDNDYAFVIHGEDGVWIWLARGSPWSLASGVSGAQDVLAVAMPEMWSTGSSQI